MKKLDIREATKEAIARSGYSYEYIEHQIRMSKTNITNMYDLNRPVSIKFLIKLAIVLNDFIYELQIFEYMFGIKLLPDDYSDIFQINYLSMTKEQSEREDKEKDEKFRRLIACDSNNWLPEEYDYLGNCYEPELSEEVRKELFSWLQMKQNLMNRPAMKRAR